ncbi:MAG: DnaJ domain-containing protein, partial [Deltaproteobacteria bacterium]|nr:DnaJ domain-containing protein [Deltaproteobacteria bacterium]
MKVNWELDFYSTLGLSPGTDQESLRKAYLQLAMKYHPDRNPGDRVAEEKFKLISQAYAVLRDPAARSRYDRMRRSSKARAAKTARSSTKKYKPSSFESQNSYRAGPGHNQNYNQNQGRADLNGRPGTFAKTSPNSANRDSSNPSSGQSHQSQFENPKSAAQAAETFSTGNRQKGSPFQGKNREEPTDSDIMADLFKTKEGRRSLNQVDEELKKAGLG